MPRIVTAAYQVLGADELLWGADLKINTVHIEDVVNGICKLIRLRFLFL